MLYVLNMEDSDNRPHKDDLSEPTTINLEDIAPKHFKSVQIRLEDAVDEVKNTGQYQSPSNALRKRSDLRVPTSFTLSSSEELRKNFRTLVSGRLATGLWALLGGVVTIHMIGVTHSASRLARFATVPTANVEEASIDIRTQLVEDSISLIDGSAKTLYSFLAPLATAVTGYYFSAIETAVEEKRKKEKSYSNFDEE